MSRASIAASVRWEDRRIIGMKLAIGLASFVLGLRGGQSKKPERGSWRQICSGTPIWARGKVDRQTARNFNGNQCLYLAREPDFRVMVFDVAFDFVDRVAIRKPTFTPNVRGWEMLI